MENRSRLILEVIEAVSAVWGSDRVGLRISTPNSYNSMIDSDPVRLSTWLAKRLNDCRLEYLHGMRGDFFQQQTAGARALRLLGFPAYTAERAARRFSRHDLETAAELDGFQDVLRADVRRCCQIGQGAGDLVDAVMGECRLTRSIAIQQHECPSLAI